MPAPHFLTDKFLNDKTLCSTSTTSATSSLRTTGTTSPTATTGTTGTTNIRTALALSVFHM